MRVHNLVKDLVIQKVEEMFARKEELEAQGICTSRLCMMDVVCFVLNRIPPKYVISGRGIAHSETVDYSRKLQQLADITTLIREGMEVVSRNKRERGEEAQESEREGFFFNFPSIIGRLLNGLNYAPVSGIPISLLAAGELVRVIDPNWQNPYEMVKNTAGTYLFWPHPLRAERPHLEKTFQFELSVESPLYEPFHYFFEISLTSESDFVDFINTTASYRIKDLCLFPRE